MPGWGKAILEAVPCEIGGLHRGQETDEECRGGESEKPRGPGAAGTESHEKSPIINAHLAVIGANVELIRLMTSFEFTDYGAKHPS
jgi:hypothetical protein